MEYLHLRRVFFLLVQPDLPFLAKPIPMIADNTCLNLAPCCLAFPPTVPPSPLVIPWKGIPHFTEQNPSFLIPHRHLSYSGWFFRLLTEAKEQNNLKRKSSVFVPYFLACLLLPKTLPYASFLT
jgi:hypothetical protein